MPIDGNTRDNLVSVEPDGFIYDDEREEITTGIVWVAAIVV